MQAMLFACADPLPLARMAQVLNLPEAQALALAQETMADFNQANSGLRIVQLEDSYQMCTAPVFAQQVRDLLEIRRNAPLSQAALEALAVIAYNQPVTKAFVEQIRGVDCAGVIGSLCQKGLVEERGRLELPGRPLLYGTTSNFLRCMGIASLDELPPPRQGEQPGAQAPEEEAV